MNTQRDGRRAAEFTVHARTDVGRVRQQNEDNYFAGSRVFAVADGMGGHAAGEVASAAALEPVKALDVLEFATEQEAQAALVDAIAEANRRVYAAGQDPELRGMGTTLTTVLVRDGRIHVAHVGDSRAYLLRGDELSQLTTDHTLVEQLIQEGRLSRDEASTHPKRSVITRAVGVDREVDVDSLHPIELQPGDQLMLCSDGLTGPVEDDVIAGILQDSEDVQAATDRLVEAANAEGGPDNISVVLLRVTGATGASRPGGWASHDGPTQDLEHVVAATSRGPTTSINTRPEEGTEDWAAQMGRLGEPQGVPSAPAQAVHRRRARRWASVLLAVLVLVSVLGGGGYLVLSRAYFVGDSSGTVTIFNGLPGDVAGIRLSWVVEETDLRTTDLPPFRQERLAEGIGVSSYAEAVRTVENLRALTDPAEPTDDTDATDPPAGP